MVSLEKEVMSEDAFNEAAFRYMREQREITNCRIMDLYMLIFHTSAQLSPGQSTWVPWDELLFYAQSSDEEYGSRAGAEGIFALMFNHIKSTDPRLTFTFDKERGGLMIQHWPLIWRCWPTG
jgi:hypothetical protein